jgi:hypothetical protein
MVMKYNPFEDIIHMSKNVESKGTQCLERLCDGRVGNVEFEKQHVTCKKCLQKIKKQEMNK